MSTPRFTVPDPTKSRTFAEAHQSQAADTKMYPPTLSYIKIERRDIEGTILGEILRYDKFVAGLFKPMNIQMMKAHCAMGISGEAGELTDCIKKEIIYGKPLDRKNLVEELGDLRFYIQATCNLYGITELEVLQTNADKLSLRYADLHYTDEAAINRADKKTGE
jgi:NTP pyrophosphatase (non-canonical NTP hydrolase)